MLLHKVTDYSEATLDHPFGENIPYISELKLDGVRLILSKFNGKVKLYTRHNNDVTSQFPELLEVSIPDGTILDGEIIVTDELGKPDFEAMLSRFHSKRSEHKVQFCVFDVIYYGGKKLTSPLLQRKELLDTILEDSEYIVKVKWVPGYGSTYFNLIKEQDLEGTVLKRADENSLYEINKRSRNWLKVINYKYADVFITGLRKDEFGLLLGIEENGIIKPAGVMEFMIPAARREFYRQYKDLIVEENKKYIYIDPKIKCRIKFRNFTKDGKLRIPSFIEYIS